MKTHASLLALIATGVAGTVAAFAVFDGRTSLAESSSDNDASVSSPRSGAAPTPRGQGACPTRMGPGGSFVLTEDLTGCLGPLWIVGPFDLDLGGHTINCENSGTGVLLEGRGATVHNGTLLDCNTGIDAAEDGGHAIHDMVVVHTSTGSDVGIHLQSNGNTVRNVVLRGPWLTGYYRGSPRGGSGKIRGIRIMGTRNRVQNVHVSRYVFGMEFADADRNRIANTSVTGSVGVGIGVLGNRNRLRRATVAATTDGHGILVVGDANVVRNSSVTAGLRDGVRVAGDGNVLLASLIAGHEEAGVRLEAGATNSRIEGNTMRANAFNEYYDQLRDTMDENEECGSNTWLNNTFGTTNRLCIH